MISPAIVLFGTFSNFTRVVLEQMLEVRLNVTGLVISGYGPAPNQNTSLAIPVSRDASTPIEVLCDRNGIPVFFAKDTQASLIEFLHRQQAEFFVTACYPRKLNDEVISLAGRTCINVHPSKLPAYRGPDPIFWQLRLGETDTGVSLHQITSVFDAGDLYSVVSVPYPTGARLSEIEHQLLRPAVDVLKDLVERTPDLTPYCQSETQNTAWFPIPCPDDYTISSDTKARVCFDFVRAYANMNLPIALLVQDRVFHVRDALEISSNSDNSVAVQTTEESVSVRFLDGSILFLLNCDI